MKFFRTFLASVLVVSATAVAAQEDVAALGRSLAKALNERSRAMEQGKGFAKFLRTGTQESKAYALVRLDMGEGVDYVKYFVAPSRAVEDWYVYTSAALFSASARFNLATILKNDSLLYSLFGISSVTQIDIKPFTELRKHLVAGNYAEAYRALEGFPEGYRKSRQWAVMRVTYGGQSGDERYRAALRHLAVNFGGDADLQLILIDHYFFEKQYDQALAGIAALEQAVGGEDASTSSLRGNFADHHEASRRCHESLPARHGVGAGLQAGLLVPGIGRARPQGRQADRGGAHGL